MNDNPKLHELLAAIFDEARHGVREEVSASEYKKLRDEFVFHMVDWAGDLDQLAKMYAHPEKQNVDAASTWMVGFLYHVIPHLKAAGRLLLDDIPDAFEKQAVSTPAVGMRASAKRSRNAS